MLILSPIDTYDPILALFKSIHHHHFSTVKFNTLSPYPSHLPIRYSHEFNTEKNNSKLSKQQTPPIFLIVCESLNARFLNQSKNGKEITPFMNKLIKNSVYTPIFYGNSIQTAKGNFATYFSMIPGLNGKVFVNQKNLNIESIATILGKTGYKTMYFNAHDNQKFDNISSFLLSHGYQSYTSIKPYLKPQDQPHILEWGPKDAIFFKRFFDAYDTELRNSPQPLFITLQTIANHFPFNSIPKNEQHIVPNPPGIPKGIRAHYANSLHLTDKGIAQFFKEINKRPELHNALIIITGDHAFPLGEHGNYNLESGHHEESFRVPLFIVWNGHLKPQHITRPSSQLDIGPTILDLLNIRDIPTTFQGNSIFSKNHHAIPLIQPYGKHLISIRWPLKYKYNTRANTEKVYHLEQDPMETTNIFKTLHQTELNAFHKDMRYIYHVNQAIVNDTILPTQ
jgi:phosphoglycerol transferase MdoB-like AlkP superfamily enzyme